MDTTSVRHSQSTSLGPAHGCDLFRGAASNITTCMSACCRADVISIAGALDGGQLCVCDPAEMGRHYGAPVGIGTAAFSRSRSLVATSTDRFLLPLRCELGEELVPRPRLGAACEWNTYMSCVVRHSALGVW